MLKLTVIIYKNENENEISEKKKLDTHTYRKSYTMRMNEFKRKKKQNTQQNYMKIHNKLWHYFFQFIF